VPVGTVRSRLGQARAKMAEALLATATLTLATHPHGYTRERYADALDGLITHLGVPGVHLLGHSHGFVTQHYALEHADRLAGIILYGSAPVTGPEHFAEAASRMEFAAACTTVRGTYVSGLDDQLSPIAIEDRELLGSIPTPTLVIVGRHDFSCGPRWAGELHGRIPGSELVVLENSGHFGHPEQPAEFARAVAGFVPLTGP
jgi:proline iminopeptidase